MKVIVILCFIISVNSEKERHLYKLPDIHLPEINFEERIFGGSPIKDGDLPYMVLVLAKTKSNKLSRCSGSLISENLVLTAAHCFPDVKTPQNTFAVAGKAELTSYMKQRKILNWKIGVPLEKLGGVQERRGDHLKIHSKYNKTSFENDLAILRVKSPFALSENVQTRKTSKFLPERIADLDCTIAGWGETKSLTSAASAYHLVSASELQAFTVGKGCLHKNKGKFYCLANELIGICKGDSGSPLVCGGEIWGVASHLSSVSGEVECGGDYEPYYAHIFEEDDFFVMENTLAESVFVENSNFSTGSSEKSLVVSSRLMLEIVIIRLIAGSF